MKVQDEEAARHDAVRTDNLTTVNRGVLTEADDQTGVVKWRDHINPEEIKTVTLGPHNIAIVPRSQYHRH